jgi:fructose-specific phosphotransferase system component IIB
MNDKNNPPAQQPPTLEAAWQAFWKDYQTRDSNETPADRAARRTANATACMAAFTLILSAASAVGVWLSLETLGELKSASVLTKAAIDAANRQADIAQQQLELNRTVTAKQLEEMKMQSAISAMTFASMQEAKPKRASNAKPQ